MNLDLYPVGWLHLAFSAVALVAGAIILVRPKGTPVHKLRGRVYLLAMIGTCLNSPLVGMTHFAVMTVFALLIGYFNAALLLRRPRPAQ